VFWLWLWLRASFFAYRLNKAPDLAAQKAVVGQANIWFTVIIGILLTAISHWRTKIDEEISGLERASDRKLVVTEHGRTRDDVSIAKSELRNGQLEIQAEQKQSLETLKEKLGDRELAFPFVDFRDYDYDAGSGQLRVPPGHNTNQ